MNTMTDATIELNNPNKVNQPSEAEVAKANAEKNAI
jgi:hypothetical protein